MIDVTFACGHRLAIDPSVMSAPVCPHCDERRVSRTTAPAPRFSGWCTGPSAELRPLAGIPIPIPRTKE